MATAHRSTETNTVENPLLLYFLLLLGWIMLALSALVVILNIPIFYQIIIDNSQLVGVPPEIVAWGRSIIRRFGELLFFGLTISLLLRSRNPRALIIAIFAAPAGAVVGGSHIEIVGKIPDSLFNLVLIVAVLPSLLAVLILFISPEGKFAPKWGRYLVFFGAIIEPIRIYTLTQTNNLVIIYGMLIPFLLVSSIGIWIQIQHYHKGDSVYKQQVKWFIFGTMSVIIGMALVILSYIILPPALHVLSGGLDEIGGIILALSLIFAITRHHLYDIDLFINRSLAYFGVFVTLMAVFAAVFVILHQLLPRLFPTIDETLLLISLVLFIALMFEPTRWRVQYVIDRNLYGFRFEIDQLSLDKTRIPLLELGVLSGQTIDGYEIRELIARGGMGEVYRGLQEGRLVALKVLGESQRLNELASKRFEREIELTVQLNHSHIVQLESHGDIQGLHYMVMEYIEGVTLATYLQKYDSLSYEEILPLLENITSALNYIHARALIHRDIKPSNIMLRKTKNDYEAVIFDFGLAKLMDNTSNVTGTGTIGTIAYMSPEQIKEGHAVDHRTDIYSLAVSTYQMLTGELPFKGNTGQILFGHINQPPPDPQILVPDIPEYVSLAIQRAMSKSPDDRYQSVEAFMAAM